jgi:hypothetical protein
MGSRMKHSKILFVIVATVVCAMVSATDAAAQRRGGGGHPSAGSAAPRGGGISRGTVVGPRIGGRGVIVGAPYRSFYRPYYRPGISFGFYAGYPFYPWGYYPYGYYGYYGYGYPWYGYPGYVAPGYAYSRGAYGGGIRIQDAPKDAQVFVDGSYAGIVDDFDGSFQHLDVAPGPHEIEVRIPGQAPRNYDVNVTPGQTLSLHVR